MGSKNQKYLGFFGPGIRAQSYCVASEPRQSQRPEWQQFIKRISFSQKAKGQQQNLDKGQQPNRAKDLHPNEEKELWQIDLPGFIKDFLTRKGLPQEQFLIARLDTYQLPDQFFLIDAIKNN
jgi:copper oxidase (laccase) domain-containing protein